MGVYAAGAVPAIAGAGAAGDGFVVAEAFCGDGRRGRGVGGGGGGGVAAEAEGEVVAVALRGGAGAEAVEDYVRYALALLRWEGKVFSLGRYMYAAKKQKKSNVSIRGERMRVPTVRTFPPTTAAPSEGERNDLRGIRTSTGFKQP